METYREKHRHQNTARMTRFRNNFRQVSQKIGKSNDL